MALGASPIEPSTIKRAIEQESERDISEPAKKPRLSNAGTEPPSPQHGEPLQKVRVLEMEDTPRPRSTSPEESSVFDNSTVDNSQLTAISEPEPDADAAAAPATTPTVTENRPRQGSMTREEARQVSTDSYGGEKAEILRLRLGLASYKVKTNQADVPLERLQVRPIPGKIPRQTPPRVLLPPFLAASPRSIIGISQRDEEKRLSSPARIEAASSRRVSAITSSPMRRDSVSSISYAADIHRSPIRGQGAADQMLPSMGLNTPQRTFLVERDSEFLDNERGGAAEGLLSLSQSSPASVLR
ncbi:hypothetical protein O1611_g4693 [Lasiodiplodia mahajangana]|uniref:Uncharacterized protein n=1 Tax=Lasiodiplodia mahajangana TaxID=1108764 RepID=A0ACC2JNG4_9PEZI|nr:hypothetical protein O1611_g4693 [Lasiodiplodia mahajangana]